MNLILIVISGEWNVVQQAPNCQEGREWMVWSLDWASCQRLDSPGRKAVWNILGRKQQSVRAPRGCWDFYMYVNKWDWITQTSSVLCIFYPMCTKIVRMIICMYICTISKLHCTNLKLHTNLEMGIRFLKLCNL